MKKLVILSMLIFVAVWAKAQGAENVCYDPDSIASYKFNSYEWYRSMNNWMSAAGLWDLKFETQHVKMYLVIDTTGKVIHVLNAGCQLNPKIEKMLTDAFLKLEDYKPAMKNGQKVVSAKLYDFNIYPYVGASFDLRVKLFETEATPGKNFDKFLAMYQPWLKRTAFFPDNYKQDHFDGLVTVEFSINNKGMPTAFKIIKDDKAEFVENSLIALFTVKPVPADYVEMIGPNKKFRVTYDYVSFALDDMYGVPSNH